MNDAHGFIRVEPEPAGRKARNRGNANQLSLRKDLQTCAATKNLVGLDEFARKLVLLRPIPRPGLKLDPKFSPRPWRDSDETALAEHFIDRGFKRVTETMIRKVIVLEAEANAFSPPRDRLASLAWDGTPRLSSFFIDHCGIVTDGESETERYVEAVTRCFFIGVVARVFEPGCKHDCMLILEGMQGTLKSSLLRILALDDGWFSDSLPHDLTSKDAREHLPGKLILEMAEVAQFRRSEIETVKSFLSCQVDRYRPSYGHHDIDWPRRNVFVGSTNADTYLVDSTGNRRFWPLKVTKINLATARAAVEQVYAEAVVAYRCGEQWWLPEDIEPIAAREQDARRQQDPWADRIEKFLRLFGGKTITTAQVLAALDIPEAKRTKADEMRAGEVLRTLGCERKTIREGDRRFKGFVVPDVSPPAPPSPPFT